jgi:hypothetical protein
MAGPTITVGVDFAASPVNTAACEVHWYAGHAVVERVDTTVDDEAYLALLEVLPGDGRLGIDCPLGWPVAFVSAVQAHHERRPWPTRGSPDRNRDAVARDRSLGPGALRPLAVVRFDRSHRRAT